MAAATKVAAALAPLEETLDVDAILGVAAASLLQPPNDGMWPW
jgi:hypothetical protein